ncbi:MAG: hypothetical protein AMXMBFR84_26250 [Candidatus Hydrogenedentota bacterium]
MTLPITMRRLPLDPRGYPIPWFVAIVDGKPDFRIADGNKLAEAIQPLTRLPVQRTHSKHCWICGNPVVSKPAFVIGPISCITGTTGEPPCHQACAEYAVRVCPHLAYAASRRREAHLPENAAPPPVEGGVKTNFEACLVWVSRSYQIHRSGNGVIFRPGPPISLEMYTDGRLATAEEAQRHIRTARARVYALTGGKK